MTSGAVSKIAAAVVGGCLFSVAANAQQANTLTPKEKSGGWQLLFNGKNLDGWHSYLQHGPAKDWSVQDGAIMLTKSKSDPREDYADLVTNRQFANFDLKLEWKAKPCIDSGVMFYVHESPQYKQTYQTGPEMQIADLACTVPDSRALLRRSAALYGLIPVKFEWVKPAGEWNQYEIIADHGHLQFFQNGHKEIDTHLWDSHWQEMVAHSKFTEMPGFGTFHKGHISLQGTEDKGAPGIKLYFRNIKIKSYAP
ncbi:MAG TPA: DUF1080 domain-containing protein [Bryobacteraceae bacterium]